MVIPNQQLRKIAREKGEKYFLPSSSCIRGHLTARRVDNSRCIECGYEAYKERRLGISRPGTQRADAWKEAKAKGEKYFFTGKPCHRGHISKRLTSGRTCIECDAIGLANLYKEKEVKRRAEGRRKQGVRQEAQQRGDKQYYTGLPCKNGHIDFRSAATAKCVSCAHEDWVRRYTENKQSYVVSARIREKRVQRSTPKWVDRKELRRIYMNCPDGHHVDHVIPIKHKLVSGLHIPANLQYLPAIDNRRKQNKFEPIHIIAG